METLELMDVYAMDRGICRIVSKIAHPVLNPKSAQTFKDLKLQHRNQLHMIGLQDEKTTEALLENIQADHRRVVDWHAYKHNLECLEEMLFEYEQTTQRPHSHDAILPCLQERVAADLNFSDEKKPVTNHHPRWKMLGNYLASQINRSYSGLIREWGVHEPDSYPFLKDETYIRASTHWNFTAEVFGTRTRIN